MSTLLHCHDLTKHFGKRPVLDGVTWEIEANTITGLLGASGAGKTTLLRIIAGLEQATAGVVERGNHSASGCLPQVGMVFQSLALWPHMTVKQHVEYVLPSSLSRAEAQRAAESVLREVQLDQEVWQSRPEQLSGGESQRVALARAIAPRPELLLLDEPLAQIDMPLRRELIGLVRSLAETRSMSVVCVSHSWADCMELCSQVAVMEAGRIVRAGSMSEVYADPRSESVARLTGPVIEIPAAWLRSGMASADEKLANHAIQGDSESVIVVRPQQVEMSQPSGDNRWQLVEIEPYYTGWRGTLRATRSAHDDRDQPTISLPVQRETEEYVGIRLTSW